MLAVDKLPTSFVEGKGIRKLLGFLAPSYNIPCAQTFRNKLKAKYETLKEVSEKKIEDASYYSATGDIWTDINNISYLGVTVHFVSDFRMNSVALALFPLNDSHTAVYIEESLRNVFQGWNIPLDKVISMTTDGAPNMTNAIKRLFKDRPNETGIWCAAHRLDLAAKSAVKSATIKPVLEKIKDLAAFFKRSVNAADALRSAQKESPTPLKLFQDVPTRWNSTYSPLERYLKIKDSIEGALHATKKQYMALTEDEDEMVQNYVAVLRPFYEATLEMSGEKLVSGSKLIPIGALLIDKMTTITGEDGAMALKSMKKRFQGELQIK